MNPLYQSYRKTQADQNDRPQNLESMLQGIAQQIMPTGMTPEQIVRQMMRNGQITQAQFEQAARVADRWTGNKR